MQQTLFGNTINPSDVVYTPELISKKIINFLSPGGKCLDPCKGDGAFYKFMPVGSDYCELNEGKDFFDYHEKVDWIIGNPPYSIFKEFLDHSFQISHNVSYLVPTNKIFQRQVIMDAIFRWGGLKSIIVFGSGQLIGFPFGFSVGNFHFQKDYRGPTEMIIGMKQFNSL